MVTYSRSTQTRHALIQAAGELAAERGFSGVSIRAVAQGSGENIGSIHYHFGSKENLFKAVLMEATRDIREKIIPEISADFGNDSLRGVLDSARTPQEQAEMVRTLVRSMMRSFFRNDQPSWYSRVVFQVLREKSDLRSFLVRELLTPFLEIGRLIFRHICPGMEEAAYFLHFLVLAAPVFFHADYMNAVTEFLHRERYATEYLEKMEHVLVRQTLCLFGLPCENPQRSDGA